MPTWVRATAETMPWVTVWPTPNGAPIADLQLVGIGEIQCRKALLGALDPQHRKIAALIFQHDIGFEFALVGERDFDLTVAVDHMIIGDHHPCRIDDYARAERALH